MRFERLGNICSVRNGYAFKSDNFSNSGVPIIRISDINDNLVSIENAVKTEYETNFENFKIEKGDILIAMSGATTGKYGQYNEDVTAYQNQRVGCFKILDTSILNQNYLFQSIKLLKPVIEKKAYGGGQPNISAKAIEDLLIPLPSLETQLYIANILTKAENLIARRKVSIRLLDEYLKSVFLEMFGDQVINKKDWKIATLVDACRNKKDIKCGPFGTQLQKSEYVEKGIPVWGIPQINSEFKIFPKEHITESKATDLNEYSVQKNDIVMSRKGNVGKCSIFPKNLTEGIIHSDVLRIRVNSEIMNPTYLLYQLRISKYIESQISNVSKGAIMAGINVGKLKNIFVQFPPIAFQTKFAQIVEKTETLKAQYQQSLQELENLYGSLSQKAFKGELNFKEDELLMAAEEEGKYKKS